MSKFKLEDNFFEEILFIGISTSLKEYQLSFFINNSLNTKFKKISDFSGDFFSKKENSNFSVYFFNDKEIFSEFFLLSNKCNTSLLLNAYKQADFFLLIKSNVYKGKASDIITSLRKIKNIFLAFNIETSKIKNFNNILIGLDYHLELEMLSNNKLNN